MQIRKFPQYSLSNGLYASKIGLEFQVQVDDTAAKAKNRKTSYYSMTQSVRNTFVPKSKQYRIKCVALMEKTIYNHKSEVHLGVSKLPSGQQLASGSSPTNGNFFLCTLVSFYFWIKCHSQARMLNGFLIEVDTFQHTKLIPIGDIFLLTLSSLSIFAHTMFVAQH